jgi:tRNA pseudouridine13 synthase
MMERWPRVGGGGTSPLPGAICKQQPEDFQVSELTAIEFSDSGEHLYGFVEKTNLTTREVARQLAAIAGVAEDDIGYAGMKDKYAVTRQWFSVPTKRDDLFSQLCPVDAGQGIAVLDTRRHGRKLRRGQLAGNRFIITLRQVSSPLCRERARLVSERGVPNYFGPQRFGDDNLEQARRWLAQRRKIRLPQFKKSLYLSVLRSFLFNEVLAVRVRDESWAEAVDGDVLLAGAASGPLWGRGRSAVAGRAAELQAAALSPHQQLLVDLEHAGVSQQLRPFCLRPEGFDLQSSENGSVTLSFQLPPGAYATVVLRELVELAAGQQRSDSADASVSFNRAAS